ncbi:hypothetical protein [Ramlibacter alkalitolerans]|uniref:DUF2897 family protein n=1 Tax=Ramlibacter alkalitolerans TaxID=2039631 RepID=A0ABS1JUF2_9BURK|nr:hypothetical protein [Ramlibacter alkalitolerans]MBL0427852.1 hypothetical protein [Ramlibacter alkalitolerans]
MAQNIAWLIVLALVMAVASGLSNKLLDLLTGKNKANNVARRFTMASTVKRKQDTKKK